MIVQFNATHAQDLYDFYVDQRGCVPFYFSTDFNTWHDSLLFDTDYNGDPLFKETEIFLVLEAGHITGFIQLAISNFVFAPDDNRTSESSYGIIRNLYFMPDCQNAYLLMDCAAEYFILHGISKPHAFFQYFGMSRYARQGKLHENEYHIETLLEKYGYAKEHENVYFSKLLSDDFEDEQSITFKYSNTGETVSFLSGTDELGGCELYFVPKSTICFLKWIYIDNAFTHKGYGTQCMKKLFYVLKQKGISRLDTDTADSNLAAQGYYRKNDFIDMGRMRSYCIY